MWGATRVVGEPVIFFWTGSCSIYYCQCDNITVKTNHLLGISMVGDRWHAKVVQSGAGGYATEQDISGAVYELAKQIEKQTQAISALVGAMMDEDEEAEEQQVM